MQRGRIQLVGPSCPGMGNCPFGFSQQVSQVIRPCLVPPDAHGDQLSEVVGVAEGVVDVVVAIELPPVVDGHPGHGPEDTEVVHGHPAASLVAAKECQERRRGRVQPVEASLHPASGLIEVDGRGLDQQVPHLIAEGTGGIGCHIWHQAVQLAIWLALTAVWLAVALKTMRGDAPDGS